MHGHARSRRTADRAVTEAKYCRIHGYCFAVVGYNGDPLNAGLHEFTFKISSVRTLACLQSVNT